MPSLRPNPQGYVADNDESHKCSTKANFKNLRRYLKKHTDIDIAITSEIQPLSLVDSTAMKPFLIGKG